VTLTACFHVRMRRLFSSWKLMLQLGSLTPLQTRATDWRYFIRMLRPTPSKWPNQSLPFRPVRQSSGLSRLKAQSLPMGSRRLANLFPPIIKIKMLLQTANSALAPPRLSLFSLGVSFFGGEQNAVN
jgi:hypothetical protein